MPETVKKYAPYVVGAVVLYFVAKKFIFGKKTTYGKR